MNAGQVHAQHQILGSLGHETCASWLSTLFMPGCLLAAFNTLQDTFQPSVSCLLQAYEDQSAQCRAVQQQLQLCEDELAQRSQDLERCQADASALQVISSWIIRRCSAGALLAWASSGSHCRHAALRRIPTSKSVAETSQQAAPCGLPFSAGMAVPGCTRLKLVPVLMELANCLACNKGHRSDP